MFTSILQLQALLNSILAASTPSNIYTNAIQEVSITQDDEYESAKNLMEESLQTLSFYFSEFYNLEDTNEMRDLICFYSPKDNSLPIMFFGHQMSSLLNCINDNIDNHYLLINFKEKINEYKKIYESFNESAVLSKKCKVFTLNLIKEVNISPIRRFNIDLLKVKEKLEQKHENEPMIQQNSCLFYNDVASLLHIIFSGGFIPENYHEWGIKKGSIDNLLDSKRRIVEGSFIVTLNCQSNNDAIAIDN